MRRLNCNQCLLVVPYYSTGFEWLPWIFFKRIFEGIIILRVHVSDRGDEARKAQILKIFLLITGHELHLLHATCLNNQLSGQGKRICNAKNDSSTVMLWMWYMRNLYGIAVIKRVRTSFEIG